MKYKLDLQMFSEITDLTGCTWIGNKSVTLSGLSLPSAPTEQSESWERNKKIYNLSYHKPSYASSGNVFVINHWSIYLSASNRYEYGLTISNSDYPVVPEYSSNISLYDSGIISTAGTSSTQLTRRNLDSEGIVITGGTDATNTELIAWLQANGTLIAPESPKVSIDVSTLQGWSALSGGNHNIQIKAKATGYRDSELSEAVTVNKAVKNEPFHFEVIEETSSSNKPYIKVTQGGSVSSTLEYKVNDGNWINYVKRTEIPLQLGDKIYFRGDNPNGLNVDYSNEWTFSSGNGSFNVSGNIMFLIDKTGETKVIPNDYCFCALFESMFGLKNAKDLILPSMTLTFGCYQSMFSICPSLVTSPALPATTLADQCYLGMFLGCSSLETIPALPATALVDSCYQSMFDRCSKIKLSETKTDEYQTEYRMPTIGIGSDDVDSFKNMFRETGGTFKGTPTINTTYYTSNEVV